MERLLLMPGARAPLLPLFEPGDPLNRNLRSLPKLLPSLAAMAAIFAVARPAAAFGTDFGDSDFKVRWDNSMRANLGVRTTAPDPVIGANPAFSAGEYSFGRGGIDTSRLDVLSELDAQWQGQIGARPSFAGWYDLAYQDHAVKIDPALPPGGIPPGYGPHWSGLRDHGPHRSHGGRGGVLDGLGAGLRYP